MLLFKLGIRLPSWQTQRSYLCSNRKEGCLCVMWAAWSSQKRKAKTEGADTLNPDLDGESRDWMGESQSQQCEVGSLNRCKAFSMDVTHSAVTLCCDAPSSRTNQIHSCWVMRFLCHPLRLDGHWMAGISRAADDSC